MDDQSLAQKIAQDVVSNIKFWVAIVGFIGVILGAVITIGGNLLLHWLQNRKNNALDAARKKLIGEMLEACDWRELSTLSRVVGTDQDTTRRLLIELKARGSEKPRDDGAEVWGLISKHPLDRIKC